MIEGIHTALITPMTSDRVDLTALIRLVKRQVEAGVQGLVICATTGEGSALREEEKRAVIKEVVREVGKKTHITVGCGCVSTWATVEATRMAADLGADAVLVVCPPYVRPSQAGMAGHFETVADEGGLPVIVYNVPSRTASDILPGTLGHISHHENIVGIKEATGSILRVQQVLAAVDGRMSVLSGDDPITVSLLAAGGHGVICTASNVVPELWVELWQIWEKGDVTRAAALQARMRDLHEALFTEANPGPAKAALHLMGLIEPIIRLPLIWPEQETVEKLKRALTHLGYGAFEATA